jgi:hypothetical protein
MKHVYERWAEDFIGLSCSDCDPNHWDDEERAGRVADGEPVYDEPFVFAIPKGDDKPDYCPRCGSYLSLSVDEDALTIHGHLIERWMAKQKAKDDD